MATAAPNRYEEIIEENLKSVRLNPQDFFSYYNLGKAYEFVDFYE